MITQDMIFGFLMGGLTAFLLSYIYHLIITAVLERRIKRTKRFLFDKQAEADDYAEYSKAYEEGRYYPDPRD